MLNKKVFEKLIYSFMTVLILINSLTPLTALAETTNQPALKLEKISKGQTDDQLDVAIMTEGDQGSEKITASQPVIQQAVLEQAGKSHPLTVENEQTIVVPISATGSGTLHLTVNDPNGLTTLELHHQQQKLSYEFEQKPEQTSDKTIESTEASSEENMAATSSLKEETASSAAANQPQTSETPKSSADIQKKAVRAEGPTDIREYFPNGDGTILTESNLVYLNENGDVVEPPVTAETTVRIFYSWSIPEDVRQQIEPGDYFDFKLPEELRPKQVQTGELKNSDGEVYAKYTIDLDGNIRFEFTEEVKNQSDINGNFFFDTEFKKEHIDGPGDITIHYPVEDDLPPVDIEIRPNTNQSIDKEGHFDRTPNPSSVEWTVDFNQSMNHLDEPTITEKWPEGIEYKSVKVMELVMNLDGTVKEVGRELNPDEYTVDANGNVTILGETNNAYRLVYQTDISDSAKPDEGGKVSFTNNAQLTDKNNDDGIDAKATVTTNFGKPVEKDMVGYDPNKQEFEWAIKYNYNEKKISKDDAIITDTISKNMDLVDGSIKLYPITFDKNGKEVKGEPLSEGTDYVLEPNPDGEGFVIKFLHDIDGAVKVEYKTTVNGIVTDPTQVTNNVTTGTGNTDGDKGTAQQQNVIKDITDINYADKKVGWKISVNKNHYHMENLILTDTYTPIPGLSMAINDDLTPDFEIRDVTKNQVLVPGQDYTLELLTNSSGTNEIGFKVVFKDDYNPTDSELEINYHTNFDVSLLDPVNPNMDRFKNNMQADWEDEHGGKHTSDDDKDFKPEDPFQLNAQKSGIYNAQTKRIKWTIAVNHSRNILNNAQLLDQIKENQDYVAGSVKVYEAEVSKNGTVVKKEPETVVNDEMKQIEEPSSSNDQTLQIDFPDNVDKTYLIEFETSVEGKIIAGSNQYTNVAQYENDGDERDVIGEVGIKNGGQYAQKTGAQDSEDPDYVNWQAVINPSQSTLDHVVIKDEPSDNQVIDPDSIKLYETTVAEDGTITPNYDKLLKEKTDYTIDVTTDNETGKQVMTINLTKKIDTAYQLEYRSYITSTTSGNKDTVSNKITVSGDNEQTISGGDDKDVTVEINHSGGSATGKKGKLVIQKTEADGKTPLSGAKFQLWNTTKTQLIREGEVNESGQIIFGNLPYGEYLLIETAAPKGFTISDDLVDGRRITVDDKTSAENAAALTIPNERNKVILQKTDENGDPIKFGGDIQTGARFKLEHFSNLMPNHSLWEPVELNPDRLNSDGLLVIDSLPLGLYRITEIEAPNGYILNSDPTVFVVYRNSNHQIPTIHLDYKNYQGSAELIKKDSEGNPLAGAEFDVIDSTGKKVNQQPLVSQADGKVTVTGLAPGDYKFVETKAPNGYVINTTEVPFTIEDTSHDKPETVTTQPDGSALELTNYKGSVEFVKKDQSGKRLVGAEFDLLDSNDNKINQAPIKSDHEGKVHVDNLAPGNYTLVETKAPEDYLINEKKIPFTIDASHKGTVSTIELSDFINYQGAFQIVKRNTDGEGLAGAEFTLYQEDKTTVVQKAVSDKNGTVTFNDLAPGTYYYQETKAPTVADGSDYVINPALIKVVIDDRANGKPEIEELGDFQNFRGKAQITKVGDGGSIAGAEFELFHIENGDQKYVRAIVVPEDGILDISGLGAGYYMLKEAKAAPGYIVNEQPIYFVVKENADQDPNVDNLDFNNYESGVVGRKVNEQKEALKGAEYQVYRANAQNQPEGAPLTVKNRKGDKITKVTTDEKGEIYFQGLEQGHYVLVETKAPEGYILDTKPHPFEITGQIGKPDKVSLGDFINYRGSVTVTKKDEAGKVLKDAEFEIQDDKGQVQTVLNSAGKETKKLISDKDGKVFAAGLVPGEYQLVETKAPKNYLLNKKKVSFNVSAKASDKPETIVLADFINYQGSVNLQKVSQSDKALAGAVFGLYHADGKQVGEYTSDQNGQISVTGLSPGDYYFKEAKAPTGYTISKEKREFTISSAKENQPATVDAGKFVNKEISKTQHSSKSTHRSSGSNRSSGTTTGSYPKTNDTRNPWLLAAGIVVIIAAGILYFRRRNK
ncbi:LPXTG cell wall anchor domain-containing protein [Enterococcus hulanensis]|uniref:SpaA isopeptide-forming pilin-related protein n=1 Tax=Enterococcus hulanensis TaxID=2559929 RepID=UPI001A8D0173|nr:SpaA isopeptide-forming pilin-related protein [Enterococcus hulanensis]MBO0455629.1 LPXTG cell wall anchor domain-containing protein [Enterococcus hulanensis]